MRERELKLSVDDEFVVPAVGAALDAQPTPPFTSTHVDQYLDTDDLRLARWGAALRFRDTEGWTVKLPDTGAGDVFDRDEVTFAGDASTPPPAAVGLVRAFSRGAPLSPVARIETERTASRWFDGDGHPLAELCDDRVSIVRGDGEPAQFRELEIELAPGADDALLEALADELESHGAVRGTTETKLGRALGGLGPPDVVVPKVGERPSARRVVRYAIARSTRTLVLHLPAARVGEDPEGVHRARVATRRLRSDLRTFGDLLDPPWRDDLRAELRWLGSILGDVRDADVLEVRLESMIAANPELGRDQAAPVLGVLDRERAAARDRMLDALDGRRLDRLLDRLVAASADPPTTKRAKARADDRLAPLVRRQWTRLRRAVDRLGRDPSPDELHRVRILAKRTRYAADAVAPAFGKQAGRFAALMGEIQDDLGELNDVAVGRAWLEAAMPQLDPSGREVARTLERAMPDVRPGDGWRMAYERASKPKRRSWFD